MDALAVATIARDMAFAMRLDTLSETFLRSAVKGGKLHQAFCYRRDATGERLVPLAGATASVESWPVIAMEELDNPLVYSLVSGQPCQVDHIGRLVAVGPGFDQLREHLPVGDALFAMPLRNAQQHAVGVCVLAGTVTALRAWHADPVWQALTAMHEQWFVRLGEQMDAVESMRYERTVRHRHEAEQGRTRAARLLAAEFVGVSTVARRVREDMLRLADSSLSTLITGETGSGKDHAAWLIHQASPRSGPFVPVNCAAISADLIEAELFGSVKGAFTGATQSRSGLVTEADGGTLFLDEIGDMPLTLQATLLRVLNEKKYRPLGTTRERESDFRLICATHQPLPQLIREGRFREDLYFRIRQLTLHMPPLRERAADIPALAMHTLLQYNRERQTHIAALDAQTLTWLQRQPFPGNVRELRNLLMAAAEHAGSGAKIGIETLRAMKINLDVPSDEHAMGQNLHGLLSIHHLPDALDAFERMLISHRLQQTDGSRSRAAQSLGIPKRTLAYKCRKLNLDEEIHIS